MNNKQGDGLYINAKIATCEVTAIPYGMIDNAALVVKNDVIVWLGRMMDLPSHFTQEVPTVIDVSGRLMTPALIDCHTHLIYAGNRANEFEMRLKGASYEEIAQAGGGILATVKATRNASEAVLFEQSMQRAEQLITEGCGLIEIKSGYGLDLATEILLLRVAQRMNDALPITIYPTFLGAHALPPEFKNRADDYIEIICQEMIPFIAEEKLAFAVDVFCEKIGFSISQTKKIFEKAKQFGLAIKCHAEQLSDSGAAYLAAEYQALSVDHLEYLSEKSIQMMKKMGTVAVLLPGAFYFLREKKLPPIEILRQQNIPIAIATDSNPGTSPTTSLLLTMNLACILFNLTVEEALLGVTRHAAKALGLENQVGTLAVGKKASIVVWECEHPAELAYFIGANPAGIFERRFVKVF